MNYSKGRKFYIIISAILVVTVAVIIFQLSAQTASESSGTSGSLINLIFDFFGKNLSQGFIRTLAHFCEYAGFGLLVTNMIFSLKDKPKPFLSILISLGYALTDEIHQIFVPGRAFQISDLTVDLGGIILGVAVFCAFIILNTKCKMQRKNIGKHS